MTSACASKPPAIPLVALPGLDTRVAPPPPRPAAPPPAKPAAAAPPFVGPPMPQPAAPPPQPAPIPQPLPALPSPLAQAERSPLPLYPTPDGRLAYLGGRFSFEVPRGWKAPIEAPGGAVLVDGDGRAGVGAAFHPEGTPDWEDPADFKHRLRSLGELEDSPLLETVVVGGRFGTRRRWTTTRYKGPWHKLGEKAETLLTETILVPDLEGIYVVWFRAPKGEFAARRAGFVELLKSLRLPAAGPDAWRPTAKERRLAVQAWD